MYFLPFYIQLIDLEKMILESQTLADSLCQLEEKMKLVESSAEEDVWQDMVHQVEQIKVSWWELFLLDPLVHDLYWMIYQVVYLFTKTDNESQYSRTMYADSSTNTSLCICPLILTSMLLIHIFLSLFFHLIFDLLVPLLQFRSFTHFVIYTNPSYMLTTTYLSLSFNFS